MARRPDSTLAWLATGLVVLTFPFVARATFDEYDGGDAVSTEDAPMVDAPLPAPTEDAGIVDTGATNDATPPRADGSRTTFGDDAGGISCAVRAPRGETASLAIAALCTLGLFSRRGRRSAKRA